MNITLLSIIETIILMLPALLVVAYVTVAERKTMASMQRRLGPNAVGYYGLLQAFADALKLILKEYIAPTQANLVLFFLGPIVTLIFALLGYAVIPYGPGLSLGDMELGILFIANSKYAFLGSLRSTAQLISYELVLSLPLFCILIIFFIGSVAETNRAPFDLAEAESELVSGFMTEHAAVIFVFFFLAEYASIVLMCIFTSILFLGESTTYIKFREQLTGSSLNGLLSSLILVRASFPRIRFDQLMSFC
ncbi:NADH dehydrogenase subunit 1 [Melampsora americana]|nr:NADH dehydrogenase subunit 1 [Melampsora americana]